MSTSRTVAVELPEPDLHFDWMVGWDEETVTANPGSGKVRIYIEDSRFTSADARELAAQILAAADYADGTAES